MYSSSTLLAVLIFLIIVNIIAIIALYRVNRKRKRQNEKLIAGWQKQNDYMDHNVEFCSKAREITQQVRRAIESYDPQQMEKDCLDECNALLSFIHGGSSAQEALILDKKRRCDALGIRFIDEIRVLGHTAQAVPGQVNNVTADRFLASNRATVVTIYLQEKDIIDPARLVSVGYGEWRPVSSNDTSAGRAENRRVELIVTGLDLDDEAGDNITQYYTMRESTGTSANP